MPVRGRRGGYARRAGQVDGAGLFHVTHLPDPGGPAYDPRAACRIALPLDDLVDRRDVPEVARCRRPGCREVW